MVMLTRAAGGPIKDTCVSKDLALALVAETLIGPSLVSGVTREMHTSRATLSQTRASFYMLLQCKSSLSPVTKDVY